MPYAGIAGEIELASRQMEVKTPTFAHQPRNWIARAEDTQVIPGSIAHDLLRPTAIQRMCTRPKAVDRCASVLERHLVHFRMEAQFLNRAVLRMPYAYAQGPGFYVHHVLSPGHVGGLHPLVGTLGVQRRRVLA